MPRKREELEIEIDWYADNLRLNDTLYEGFLSNLLEYFDAGSGAVLLLEETTATPYTVIKAGPHADLIETAAGTRDSAFLECLRCESGRWIGTLSELLGRGDGYAMVAAFCVRGREGRVDAVEVEPPQSAASDESATSGPEPAGITQSRASHSTPPDESASSPEFDRFSTLDELRRVCGAVVLTRTDRPFEASDVAVLELFARQSGESFSQVDLLLRQGTLIRQQRHLACLGAMLNTEQDADLVREKAIDSVRSLLSCEASSLILFDPDSGKLKFDVATGTAGDIVKQIVLEKDEGVAGWVIRNNKSFLSNKLDTDKRHSRRVDEQIGFVTRELVCVPLVTRGRVVGALQAVNSRKGGFSSSDVTLLELLSQHVATALENSRLTNELRSSLAKLKNQQDAMIQAEKLSAMGLLAAGVAHEIRSPLTAISGYAQLLKRHLPKDDPLGKKIGVIERSVNSINRIVNGLLDFAKKEEACWEQVSVNDIVEDALMLAEHTLARFKRVRVERRLNEDLPAVEADPRALQQVFLNLIINGAEAMSRGGTLTISTYLDSRDGVPAEEAIPQVVTSFKDTGCGIPECNRKRIFEPFFTDGKKSGTGLGLSICRSIMKKHRGEVSFACDDENGGTTFYVSLPVLSGGKK